MPSYIVSGHRVAGFAQFSSLGVVLRRLITNTANRVFFDFFFQLWSLQLTQTNCLEILCINKKL